MSYLNDAVGYDFFQLLRILEQHYSVESLLNNGLNALSLSLVPAAEMGFPASDIRGSHCDSRGVNTLELQLNFMGLYGVDSPLPPYWKEYALRSDDIGDRMCAFLNIFNQRIYVLLYLAWKKHQAIVQIEQSDKGYLRYLQAISGQALMATDTQEFAYAGILGQRAHNATHLAEMLSHYLGGIHVNIHQNIPRWIKIETVSAFSNNATIALALGDNMILGSCVLDSSSRIHIIIGPVTKKTAFNFLTDLDYKRQIVHLISRYCGAFYEFAIKLIVTHDNSSSLIFGRSEIYLGWTSWIGRGIGKKQLISIHYI